MFSLKIFLGNLACNYIQNGCNLTNYQRKRNGMLLLLQFLEVQHRNNLNCCVFLWKRRVHSLNGRLVRMNRVLLIFIFSNGFEYLCPSYTHFIISFNISSRLAMREERSVPLHIINPLCKVVRPGCEKKK